jgi:gliding motility-associated-like protein
MFTDESSIENDTIVSWTWICGQDTTYIQNPYHTFKTPGIYQITLITASTMGCTDTLILPITVYTIPVPLFDYATVCPDSAIFHDLSQGTVLSWNWAFGDSTVSTLANPTHTYPGPETYIVTLTVASDSGCTAVFSDTIVIEPCPESDIFGPALPTAFSPNGDGKNDLLIVRGGPFKSFEFRIFNEWGNQLFITNDASQGWDGTYKGEDQPVGNYVWIIICETADNIQYKLAGEVLLLR